MSKQKPHKSKRKTYGNNSMTRSKAIPEVIAIAQAIQKVTTRTAKTQNSRHIFHMLKTCTTTVTMLVILKDHYGRS